MPATYGPPLTVPPTERARNPFIHKGVWPTEPVDDDATGGRENGRVRAVRREHRAGASGPNWSLDGSVGAGVYSENSSNTCSNNG